MKKAIKDEWVKRLRSGKYKKVKGRLRSGDCMCVLGVLVDIAVSQGIGRWVLEGDKGEYVHRTPGQDDETGGLNRVVRNWAGLKESYDPLIHDERSVNFFKLNDNTDLTLAQIADIIEKHNMN